jgi:hypothetical protein
MKGTEAFVMNDKEKSHPGLPLSIAADHVSGESFRTSNCISVDKVARYTQHQHL